MPSRVSVRNRHAPLMSIQFHPLRRGTQIEAQGTATEVDFFAALRSFTEGRAKPIKDAFAFPTRFHDADGPQDTEMMRQVGLA